MSRQPDTVVTNPQNLEWGDRVDHKKFGLGTVSGEPEGDKILVDWDDPKRAPTRVVGSFLRLVTRPDAKGGAFWGNEYRKLLEAVQAARKTSEVALANAFRATDGQGLTSLEKALEAEKAPLDALRDFLKQDEKGDHP